MAQQTENVDFRLSATDGASAVFKEAQRGLDGLAKKVFDAKAILGTLGAAVSAQQFVSMILGTTEAIARYKDLALIAGTTAENISGLEEPARLAGISLDSVASSVAKLGRSIGEARLGDVGKRSLFEALGIDPDDGRDAAEVMVDVARALSGMKDQTVAGKVANDLLGKSYAELRPFMQELAEQGRLVARVTNEDAEKADKFRDDLSRLGLQVDAVKMQFTVGMLPALNEISAAMVKASKEGGVLQGIIAGIQVALTGTDQFKNDKELFELTGRQFDLENRLMRLRANPPIFSAASAIRQVQRELDEVNAKLQTTLAYRKVLEEAEARAAAGGAVAGAGTATGEGGSDAEARVRERMYFEKHYQERVTAAQGFYQRYADAIKLGSALAQEAQKQGMLGASEVAEQERAAEDARLQVLIISLQEQRALHQQMGQLAQARAAQEQIGAAEAMRLANEAIAAARQTSREAQLQDDLAAINNRFTAEIMLMVSNIELQNMTEMELLKLHLANKQSALDVALRNNFITQEFYEKQTTKLKKQEENARLQSAAQAFGNLASLMQTHGRAAFEAGKVAAISQALIATYLAANRAFADGAQINFWVGVAYAAAATVAGLVNVNQIRSQQFGGGAAATPVFSANPSTGVPDASPQPPTVSPITQAAAVQRRDITITFIGSGRYTQEEIRESLIPALNDALGDGVILRTV